MTLLVLALSLSLSGCQIQILALATHNRRDQTADWEKEIRVKWRDLVVTGDCIISKYSIADVIVYSPAQSILTS